MKATMETNKVGNETKETGKKHSRRQNTGTMRAKH